jgi:protein HOOK3
MNRDEMDALEVLKETNELITTSLQNDLQVVQNDYRNVTTDFEQQKTHLLQTLLAKEQLMKDLADARDAAAAGGEKAQPDENDKEVVRKSQEVSHHEIILQPESPQPNTPSRKRKFWSKLRLKFPPHKPYIPQAEVTPVRFPQEDTDTLAAAELAFERAAIGRGPPVIAPQISPRTVILPPSPAIVQDPPQLVQRAIPLRAFSASD